MNQLHHKGAAMIGASGSQEITAPDTIMQAYNILFDAICIIQETRSMVGQEGDRIHGPRPATDAMQPSEAIPDALLPRLNALALNLRQAAQNLRAETATTLTAI